MQKYLRCMWIYVHLHWAVTHNTCSLHLATHFQNQTSHMGMFYMVYWWQG